MSIKLSYQKLLNNQTIVCDQAQLVAVDALDNLSALLDKRQKHGEQSIQKRSLLSRTKLKAKNNNIKTERINGIYFYGRVGRGKTMLMDLFFQQLNIKDKRRIHFHRFMRDVHQQLQTLSGVENPLEHVANYWTQKTKVLCFDEFFVSDIGDAMLLAGLFSALFERGVVLVTTSNCHPDVLYRNGLQRKKFIPTIALIKQHCDVISIDGEQDHRLAMLTDESKLKNYFVGSENDPQCYAQYLRLTQCRPEAGMININNRVINYHGQCDDVIWFDFSQLCTAPRSQNDYIVLADRFNTIIVSQVMQFTGEVINEAMKGIEEGYIAQQGSHQLVAYLDDEARRFIALVDELYDRKIRLVVHASVEITKLYLGDLLAFEFDRCQSRLIEMQTW